MEQEGVSQESELTMDFNMSEDQRMVQDMVQDLGKKEILPHLMEWDEKQELPIDLMKNKMGELGLMGVLVPQEYGGSGMSYFEYYRVISEVGRYCGSIGLSLAAHNSLCTGHILQFGNEEQKQQYLPKLASGEFLGSWALTEPNTGSDAMRMKCVAEKQGEYWVLNGTKCWITHGISSDVAVVIARTGELGDSKGMTAFIVDRDNPGMTGGKKEDKLGMRASETAELVFEDCKVHESMVLGEIGEGFKQAMKILDGGRISIAALSLGIAKGALQASIDYSKEREQFGKPISEFQGIAFKIADMATEIEAAELLTLQAADLKERGKKVTKISSMAKYYASEISVKASNEAVQIFGGYGYTKEFPVEKYYRDSKLCTIGEGTSEIQKLVISRELLEE